MNNQKRYYLYQLLAALAFSAMSYLSVTMVYPDLQNDIVGLTKVLLSGFSFVFWAHFVIRLGIKRLHTKRLRKWLRVPLLCLLVLVASIGDSLIQMSSLGLSSGQHNSDNGVIATVEKTPVVNMTKRESQLASVATSSILYGLWLGIYLSITSSRDKRHIKRKLDDEQLENLKNQLNPHFLFNALNSVRGMIFEDREVAAQLVTELSELLRYNLTSNSNPTCSLEQELQICKRLIYVEQVRLGERLTVQYDLEPRTLEARLPAMSIFTLVENAIKHGIAPLELGGDLIIKSRFENGILTVNVENPFDPSIKADGTNTGLNNLKERLLVLYAGLGDVSIQQTSTHYAVRLSVPYDY